MRFPLAPSKSLRTEVAQAPHRWARQILVRRIDLCQTGDIGGRVPSREIRMPCRFSLDSPRLHPALDQARHLGAAQPRHLAQELSHNTLFPCGLSFIRSIRHFLSGSSRIGIKLPFEARLALEHTTSFRLISRWTILGGAFHDCHVLYSSEIHRRMEQGSRSYPMNGD
jgi:hypothetical protein